MTQIGVRLSPVAPTECAATAVRISHMHFLRKQKSTWPSDYSNYVFKIVLLFLLPL